jgi:hypothetical protein
MTTSLLLLLLLLVLLLVLPLVLLLLLLHTCTPLSARTVCDRFPGTAKLLHQIFGLLVSIVFRPADQHDSTCREER